MSTHTRTKRSHRPRNAPCNGAQPPSLLQIGREARVVWETLRAGVGWPWRKSMPAVRDRDPVLVIPGFLANDSAMCVMRSHLASRGYAALPWALGCNRGPRGDTLAKLAQRIRRLAREHRRPVQLVGWSLGGLLARIVAARVPHCVSRVVTLGSPLTGDPKCSHLAGPLMRLCGRGPDDRYVRAMLRASARVPVTSIYSKSDGVVAWEASAYAPGPCAAIEVDSSHMGLVVNPDVLDVVATELATPAKPLQHQLAA